MRGGAAVKRSAGEVAGFALFVPPGFAAVGAVASLGCRLVTGRWCVGPVAAALTVLFGVCLAKFLLEDRAGQ